MTPAPEAIAAQVLDHERRVWAALETGDAAADLGLLDARFLGLYPDGPADRAAHAAQVSTGPSVGDWQVSDLRVMALSDSDPGLALIVYRASFLRLRDESRQDWWISSIWRAQGDGGWTNIFSQDTPATPD